MNKHQVLIAFGSNLGDRRRHLQDVLALIEASGSQVVSQSSLHFTEPVGAADQEFLNCALLCTTDSPPLIYLQQMLTIEKQLGRERKIHWGNRTVDLDILMWKDAQGSFITMNDNSLCIPHPRMLERSFMLMPAAEIAGDWIHPLTQKTLAEESRLRGFHHT